MKAQWLHRQTEGIPALLLPMLTEYTIRDVSHTPSSRKLITKELDQGLSPEQWSILQALTNGDRPLTATELKALIPSYTLEMLIDYGIVRLLKNKQMQDLLFTCRFLHQSTPPSRSQDTFGLEQSLSNFEAQ